MTTHEPPQNQNIDDIMRLFVSRCQDYIELPARQQELENLRVKYQNEVTDLHRRATSAASSANDMHKSLEEMNSNVVANLARFNLTLPTYTGDPEVTQVTLSALEKHNANLRHSKNSIIVLLDEINAIVQFYSNIKILLYIILMILVLVVVLVLTGKIKLSDVPNANLLAAATTTVASAPANNQNTVSITNRATDVPTVIAPTATAQPAPQVEIQAIVSSSQAAKSKDNAGRVVTFDPQNLIDGDFTTAWRTPINESQIITMTLATISMLDTVEFTPGWVYTDTNPIRDRFVLNYQVTEFEIILYDESLVSEDAQFSYYKPVCIISQQIDKPQRGYYVVDLKNVDCTQSKEKPIRYVVLKVISIVKPDSAAKNFVAMSDIRVTGQ